MKKCPFRKLTEVTDYYWGTSEAAPRIIMENFDDCIGKECMAYNKYSKKPYWDASGVETYERCLLMNLPTEE